MPSLLTNSAAAEQQEQQQESKPVTKSTDEPEFASDDYKSTDVETGDWPSPTFWHALNICLSYLLTLVAS